MPGPALFFSTLMSDDAKSIARGLQKRDPDLLDRLIEQYQYRLFRYLVYITGNKERAEDFFQETWIRVLERGLGPRHHGLGVGQHLLGGCQPAAQFCLLPYGLAADAGPVHHETIMPRAS